MLEITLFGVFKNIDRFMSDFSKVVRNLKDAGVGVATLLKSLSDIVHSAPQRFHCILALLVIYFVGVRFN